MSDEKKIPYKIYLEENEMPDSWYNVRADMKNKPAPLLNPGTLNPLTFEEVMVSPPKSNRSGFPRPAPAHCRPAESPALCSWRAP